MSDSNFDGVLDPDSGWPDIPQASTQFVVLGGPGGPLNEQAKALAARTKKLKSDIDNLSDAAFGGQYRKLVVIASGTGYQGTITADRLVVEDSSHKCSVLRDVNLSFDGGTSGANGIDAGSIENGNWYYIYVIYNDVTVSALISLSKTNPVLPSGYKKNMRVGAAYVKAAETKFRPATQLGDKVSFGIGSTQGTESLVYAGSSMTYVAVSAATVMPPTASELHLQIAASSGTCGVYPDNGVPAPFYSCISGYTVSGYCVLKQALTFYYRMIVSGAGYVLSFGYRDAI